jgi:hypothetical protein
MAKAREKRDELPWSSVGYGRFRFKAEKVVKWNRVFRVQNEKGIASGKYRFRMFVAVGTLEDVRKALELLTGEFGGASGRG